MSETVIEGGCLCGAVRYRFGGEVRGIAHCHCTMCRRATGTVATTWLTVPLDSFEVVIGAPRTYQSSERARRTFCGACGSPLTFFHAGWPDDLDVTLGTLDHPEVWQARKHIWTSSRLPHFRLDPDLPSQSEDQEG